jgi:hypothetical protein
MGILRGPMPGAIRSDLRCQQQEEGQWLPDQKSHTCRGNAQNLLPRGVRHHALRGSPCKHASRNWASTPSMRENLPYAPAYSEGGRRPDATGKSRPSRARRLALSCRLLRRRARDLHVRRWHVCGRDLHSLECGAAGGRAEMSGPRRGVPARPGHLRGRRGRTLNETDEGWLSIQSCDVAGKPPTRGILRSRRMTEPTRRQEWLQMTAL